MMVMSSRRSLRLAPKNMVVGGGGGDSGDPKAVLAFKISCEREAVSNGTWPAPFEERMTKASSRGELASPAESRVEVVDDLNGRTGASTPTSTSPRAGIAVGEPVTPPRRAPRHGQVLAEVAVVAGRRQGWIRVAGGFCQTFPKLAQFVVRSVRAGRPLAASPG